MLRVAVVPRLSVLFMACSAGEPPSRFHQVAFVVRVVPSRVKVKLPA
jgi:hypothetical protein